MVYNPYIVVPAATWVVAQVIKFALAAFRGRLDFRYLYASGGMPSVHSAIVTSLATTALLVDGVDSHLFGFTLIFAVIVMYDSFGVRRAAGEQGKAINMALESMERGRIRLDQPGMRVREILGHQPEEVTVGAILGIILGCLFNYTHLGAVGTFLQGLAHPLENIVYAAIGGVLIIGSIVQRIIISKRKSQTMANLSRQLLILGQTIGWLTLLASVLIYERASYVAWRAWVLVVLVGGIVWLASLVSHWRGRLAPALMAERVAARKRRWLTFGRRKKTS